MKFISKIFGKDSVDDEDIDLQRRDIEKWIEGFKQLGYTAPEIEPDCEELPGAYDSSGTSVTNPIPVNGPVGELVYLNRLRSKNGSGFYFHRLGSVSSPICNQKIDVYELVASDASEWLMLYFSMYHSRRSTKVPDGLSLLPWKSLPELNQMMLKMENNGVREKVKDFPFGLPALLAQHEHTSSSGLGGKIPERISVNLLKYDGRWSRPMSQQMHEEQITGMQQATAGPTVGQSEITRGESTREITMEQSVQATLLDQIGKHLQFLGYEITDQENGFFAIHISKPRFRALPYLSGVLFSCRFTMGEKANTNRLAYLDLLNSGNRLASVSRFYAEEDNTLVHECVFLGDYDRVQFGRFFDSWERDYQQVGLLPEAVMVF